MAYADPDRRRECRRLSAARCRARIKREDPDRWLRIKAKDAARRRIAIGHARVGDARLIGKIPPKSLDDGWWSDLDPQGSTEPQTPIEGTQSSSPESNDQASLPEPEQKPPFALHGLLKSLQRDLTKAGRARRAIAERPKPIEAIKAAVRAALGLVKTIASPSRHVPEMRWGPILAVLRLSHAWNLSPGRLEVAAQALWNKFGFAAPARVLAMIADVLTDPNVRNPGAVVAYRVNRLICGNRSGWPELVPDVSGAEPPDPGHPGFAALRNFASLAEYSGRR